MPVNRGHRLRDALASDAAFIVEMARLASVIEERPLPDPGDPEVVALLPPSPAAGVVAEDGASGARLGAAWWHWHQPPLLCGASGSPLPEVIVAVEAAARNEGIGTSLVHALARRASSEFDALALNVHLRNPAARLYTRAGFEVAGAGRGRFGVAMRRDLSPLR